MKNCKTISKVTNTSGEDSPHVLTSFSDCLACKQARLQHFSEQLRLFPQMERSERIKMMTQFQHTLKMRYAIQTNNFEQVLQQLIIHETEEQQGERSAEASASAIDPQCTRLTLDGDEGELARAIFGALSKNNKKGRPFYSGDKSTLARWICEVIRLENNKPLHLGSVRNSMSM